MNLSTDILKRIIEISSDLEIDYNDLIKLINFESGFNPHAKNPLSSARGLIQFIDSTSRELGFANSLDLVNQHPTVLSQLDLVYEYLVRYYPFKNKQELYLSVFLPSYRKLNPETILPEWAIIANPGIKTIQDYVDLVERKESSDIIFKSVSVLMLLSIVGIVFFLMKGKSYVGNRTKRN